MKKLCSFFVSRNLKLSRDMCHLAVDMRYLRILDLHGDRLEKLPSKIGELLHLRYLELSENKLDILPNSIIQLYNLQTLKLRGCMNLEQLPRNLSKLVNLRHLDISGCDKLRHMPPRMDSMTTLHKLPLFVVGKGNVGGLDELENLNHLRGFMEIKMKRGWTYDAAEQCRSLAARLQPHYNIRRLRLEHYPGVSFPSWGDSSANLKTCLPNLVQIEVLKIKKLGTLEYVESRSNSDKALSLSEELKGWWKPASHSDSRLGSNEDEREIGDVDHANNHSKQQQEFPALLTLEIARCHELKSFPLCPKVETLADGKDGDTIASTSTSNNIPPQGLRTGYNKTERLTTKEVFQSGCLPSLGELQISMCIKLKSVSRRGVWEQFTALETLKLQLLSELEVKDEEEEVNMSGNGTDVPWRCLALTL
ncbi:putative disease resistance protein RGA4, partial [Bienertia sinuspersici]